MRNLCLEPHPGCGFPDSEDCLQYPRSPAQGLTWKPVTLCLEKQVQDHVWFSERLSIGNWRSSTHKLAGTILFQACNRLETGWPEMCSSQEELRQKKPQRETKIHIT
jgi:hypothetical protein